MTRSALAMKHCKTLLASGSTTLTPPLAARFFDKLIYEFWGFCINGGTSLVNPGAIVDLSYPPGFVSGSSVLLATGNDGFTTFGSSVFTSLSTDFLAINSGRLIGKYLVTWVPNSTSFDDSIYMIVGVENANQIRVDIHSGGQRRLGNYPVFWTRDNINFRIVDFVEATRLPGWSNNHYMVLSLEGAPAVNEGQAVPQLQIFHTSSLTPVVDGGGTMALVISPSGSWNFVSKSFSDGTPPLSGSFMVVANSSPAAGRASNVIFSVAGSKDFLMGHVRADSTNSFNVQFGFTFGSGFHVEIPQRLYPKEIDPNPIAWTRWSDASPSQIAGAYYNGWSMVDINGAVNSWTTYVRSPGGTRVRPEYTGVAFNNGQWQQFPGTNYRFSLMSYDQLTNSYITSDGLLGRPVSGSFSARRVRLRNVRFTTANFQRGARLGDPIETGLGWAHVANGVLWPWDNSILPQRPWRYGV